MHPGWQRSELVYCSNVHPGESLKSICTLITEALAGVRSLRSLETMGSGLWLSNEVADQIVLDEASLNRFQKLLEDSGIELFTLNGFPFGGFHDTVVKERVYQPDWSRPERLDYTLKLAKILAHCLPEHYREGSISTLPLGFQPGWNEGAGRAALDALCTAAAELDVLRQQSGRSIRICLEMEPGCVLEHTAQVIDLFHNDLPAAASRQGIGEDLIRRHLGVCFDVCHQAVMFEDPMHSLECLAEQGISVGKIQISSALEMKHPGDIEVRKVVSDYMEPRYLHQVRTCLESDDLDAAMDLPDALESHTFSTQAPWRIHFHVPIQAPTLADGRLHTTRADIQRVLDFLMLRPDLKPHLEVETYTWQVLPEASRPRDDRELWQGISNELNWLEEQMQQRNLLAAKGN